MTPMIDVVFLLLIYFMVATDFVVTEEIYRLDLPQRLGSGAPDDPFELERDPVRIGVHTTGPEPEDYALDLAGPWPQPTTFEELLAFLQRNLIRDEGSGLFPRDHPILVAPDPDTGWEHAVEAFSTAVRAGYVNVQFVPTS